MALLSLQAMVAEAAAGKHWVDSALEMMAVQKPLRWTIVALVLEMMARG